MEHQRPADLGQDSDLVECQKAAVSNPSFRFGGTSKTGSFVQNSGFGGTSKTSSVVQVWWNIKDWKFRTGFRFGGTSKTGGLEPVFQVWWDIKDVPYWR